MAAFSAFHDRDRPEAVAAFLAAHEPLRELLEPMLQAADDDAPGEAAAADGPLAPGRTFGDYRLRREVGRGGMGTVYEAEQISLRRRVALKVLHEHLTWSPEATLRFRSEAAATARLRHAGIVPIHEVGECDGRHYFSMEFVCGRPLHELVFEQRLGVRADCSRAAEVAELVARVADALQHAHDHGLLHRDVKPHNIMVAADGSVRLLDFGLVKELAPSAAAVTQDCVGTPHYCSPEQIAGAGSIDPRADVFALGIVLYELLARRRPFDGDTARAVLRRIEQGGFEPLRRAAPATPRDLETICHKALEPAPAARYASAGDFAADLRRFLRIEPILARSPGALSRLGKWLRRHRLGVALGATATLLVVGTPLAYAVHLQRTNAAIEGERELLTQAERLAFDSIEQTLSMLGDQLDRQPGPGSRQQPRVDAVVALCEAFLALRAQHPDRRERAARAYYLISHIDSQLGDCAAALQACARGLQLLDADGTGAGSRNRDELRGRLLRRQLYVRQCQDPSGGADEFEQALLQWQQLAEQPDADHQIAVDYAETLVVRARALADLPPRRLEAERLLRRALAVLPAARRQALPAAEVTALRAGNALGHVLLWTGRAQEALSTLTAVIAGIDRLDADPILGVEKVLATAAIGDAQLRLQQPQAAESSLRRAIDGAAVLVAQFPGSQQLRRALLRSRVRLGTQLLTRRAVDAAEVLLREAAAGATERSSWMDRALLADLDVQLANCILIRCNGGSDCDEARQLLHSGCELLAVLVREQPGQFDFQIDLGAARNNLAALANQRGEAAAAAAFAEQAIADQRAVLAQAPHSLRARKFLGMHHGQLALALATLGRGAEAVAAARLAAENAPRHGPTLRLAAEAAANAAAADAAHADAYADAAVAILRQLAALDLAEARRLLPDDRFAGLRRRPGFIALLQQVGQ